MSGAVSAQYGITCPKCSAEPWQPCRTLKTRRITDTHMDRIAWASVLSPVPRPEESE